MNSSNIEKFISIATISFADRLDTTVEQIHTFVDEYPTQIHNFNLSNEEKKYIKRQLESMIQTTMGSGSTLKDKTYKPWLRAKSENIEFYYWNRYKRLLFNNHFGPSVINKIDIVTDEILDLLQDPDDDGTWNRKGLVVGHVQSGKTANYIGLISKAFDSGYKIVIILAGLLNSLRKQTQSRVEEGIIGLNSARKLEQVKKEQKLVGVGKIDLRQFPVTLTTIDTDFNKRFADGIKTALNQYKDPIVFVIKKNVGIIKNLTEWLTDNNFSLEQFPLLLIDDEADHASINTKKNDLDPTKTNLGIRKLLDLFPKNVYLGYTATPFANIFIDPDTDGEMVNDLFPENFIKSLDAPSNYFGGEKIYLNNEHNAVITVDDHEDILPLSHKIEDYPDFLPDSLIRAIKNFILVCAIRNLRGDANKANSMLVNVSRFTGIQTVVKDLIHLELSEIRDSIKGYYALGEQESLKNTIIKSIKEIYDKEYKSIDFSWLDVLKNLNKAVSKIQTIEVNGSAGAEKDIDYSKDNYPNGRSVIAVGGISLSRGITLEGLSISYFLRNSLAYDTLMQMGRWFGYRPGYEDLCRIYMTDESKGYYSHITSATEELRSEFRQMMSLDMTPKDFGLKVRNHPESLLVTARNKMRSARTIVREIDLSGQDIQTSRLYSDTNYVNHNIDIAGKLYKTLNENEQIETNLTTQHKLWREVQIKYIFDFVENYQNHPESMQTETEPVLNYIKELYDKGYLKKWNIVFASPRLGKRETIIDHPIDFEEINPSIRESVSEVKKGILLPHRSLTAQNMRTIDLNNNDDDRKFPLLIIYLLDCRFEKNKNKPVYKNGVIGYSICFPKQKYPDSQKVLATYQVNTTWMKQQYNIFMEDDNDIGEDIE